MSNLESPIKKLVIGTQFKYTGDPFFCTNGTCDDVRNVLGEVYQKRSLKSTRLRIWYGNTETGRAWNDTFNVAGYIGRSASRHPQPVVQQFKSAMQGEVLSTDKIIRIDIVETGETVYRHKHFHVPAFTALANVKESLFEIALKHARRVTAKLHQRVHPTV